MVKTAQHAEQLVVTTRPLTVAAIAVLPQSRQRRTDGVALRLIQDDRQRPLGRRRAVEEV